MAITLGLDTKLSGDAERVSGADLNWEDIEDGKYNAELKIVYPWKKVTHDSKVRLRDEDGKYIKDDDGKFVQEIQKELSWFITDMVFVISGGIYDGHAVKGTISTHPDMIGSAKRFLYNAKWYDVTLEDLYNHVGTKVAVNIKHKTDTFKDKTTGAQRTVTNAYVSWYDKYDESLEDTGI